MADKKVSIWLYLLGFVLIVTGIFAGLNLYNTYFKSSQIIGAVNLDYKLTSFEELYNIDCNGPLTFVKDSTNNCKWSYTEILEAQEFDGTRNSYQLLLNDKYIGESGSTAGKISSTSYMFFYDTELNIETKFKVTLTISFYTTETEISVIVEFENAEDIGYWNSYLDVNGINVQVINRVVFSQDVISVSKSGERIEDSSSILNNKQNEIISDSISSKPGYSSGGSGGSIINPGNNPFIPGDNPFIPM